MRYGRNACEAGAKKFSNIQGFDVSLDAIGHTRKNVSSNAHLLEIPDADKAYSKASLDIIICHDILCLLKNRQDKLALGKLVPLLKPVGCFL